MILFLKVQLRLKPVGTTEPAPYKINYLGEYMGRPITTLMNRWPGPKAD